MLHGKFLFFLLIFFIASVITYDFIFSKGVQTYDERMSIISRSSSKIMSKLSNRKVIFFFFFFAIYNSESREF